MRTAANLESRSRRFDADAINNMSLASAAQSSRSIEGLMAAPIPPAENEYRRENIASRRFAGRLSKIIIA